MSVIAPNFLSVRMTDEDRTNYQKVVEHMQRTTGLKLGMGDVYRLAVRAYAKEHGIKVV